VYRSITPAILPYGDRVPATEPDTPETGAAQTGAAQTGATQTGATQTDAVATDAGTGARLRDPLGHDAVPRGVQVAAAWCWRLLLIAGAIYVAIYVVATLQLVIVPLLVAILLNALIQPIAAALVKRGLANALAAVIVLIGSLGVLGLLIWLVVHQARAGYDDLASRVDEGINKIRDWLVTGPLQLSQDQIDSAIQSAKASLRENRSTFTAGAVRGATTVGHVLTGALLTLFATFFLLKDGREIWAWVVRLFPRASQAQVRGAGAQAWRTLVSYVRATIAVAAVDAVGIGLAIAVLGVPLALPLAVLVFLGAFVPIIGALLTGLVAVLVALVANGPVTALLVLAAVILVQQLEGHVLQPVLLGRAVRVHPLAVVLSIAAGVLLAGIVGALTAVPVVAVANAVASYLSRGRQTLTPTEADTTEAHTTEAHTTEAHTTEAHTTRTAAQPADPTSPHTEP
jgi:predicted PurR-regulated permease PerM